MNKRIKELIEQSSKRIEFVAGQYHDKLDAEKFAELIVKECVKSTLELHDIAIKHNWETDETFHMIVDNMAEKFEMQHIFRNKGPK